MIVRNVILCLTVFVFPAVFPMVVLAQSESTQADFYVATDGNDNWSGTLASPNTTGTDGPFATLATARDAVRELKRSADRDIVVLIRGGRYYLKETVVFGLQDSGADGHTIMYAAYPGEEPVFSSGVQITDWREVGANRPDNLFRPEWAPPNVWVADVPSALGRFHTLYDGDRRLPQARSIGFAPTDTTTSDRRRRGPRARTTLSFPEGALKNWSNLEDVEILIRPTSGWVMNILGLESVDEQACIATTTVPGTYPLRKLRSPWSGDQSRSVWVENVLEVLDYPGEWVLNTQERKLYLWPENKWMDQLGTAVDYMKQQGLIAGMAGHDKCVPIECEKAGLRHDFYFKTLHNDNYWSALPRARPRREGGPSMSDGDDHQAVPVYKDCKWSHYPQDTIAFMENVTKPWIAYKTLAAGAIHPSDGFQFAFENGADFLCVGMFDFQIREDVIIAKKVLADDAVKNRARPWA